MFNQKESNIDQSLAKLKEVGDKLEAIDESKLDKEQLAKIQEAKANFIKGALGIIQPNMVEIEGVLNELKKGINLEHVRSELTEEGRKKFDAIRPEVERLSKEGDYAAIGEIIKNI